MQVCMYADTHWREEDMKLRYVPTVGKVVMMTHATNTSKKTALERTVRMSCLRRYGRDGENQSIGPNSKMSADRKAAVCTGREGKERE